MIRTYAVSGQNRKVIWLLGSLFLGGIVPTLVRSDYEAHARGTSHS